MAFLTVLLARLEMSTRLAVPISLKHVHRAGASNWRMAAASMQGTRLKMEVTRACAALTSSSLKLAWQDKLVIAASLPVDEIAGFVGVCKRSFQAAF